MLIERRDMKIDDRIWRFVSCELGDMQKQSDRLADATNGLMIPPESPLLDVQYKTEASLVSALSLLIGDEFDALNWFVYECDYGRGPKEAGPKEDMRLIDSHDKLRWLIEISNEDTGVE